MSTDSWPRSLEVLRLPVRGRYLVIVSGERRGDGKGIRGGKVGKGSFVVMELMAAGFHRWMILTTV